MSRECRLPEPPPGRGPDDPRVDVVHPHRRAVDRLLHPGGLRPRRRHAARCGRRRRGRPPCGHHTIGPLWDGNEVWLVVAGAGMFAAFPGWYPTMFSGLYLALVVLLAALIVRGVSFEFRGKVDGQRWRQTWDWLLTGG